MFVPCVFRCSFLSYLSGDKLAPKKPSARKTKLGKEVKEVIKPEINNDNNEMDMELKSLVLNLSRKCTAKNLNLILNNDEYQNGLRKILKNLHRNE